MKTRTIEQHQLVPHTVDGVTKLVVESHTIEVPAPPRDWDKTVRTAVTVGAVVLVIVSLAWTTTSIGELLAASVLATVAYGAAVAFDATWIMCMAVEWLLRYDLKRAVLPQRAGHVALGISMGAVFANSALSKEWVVGAVGALVSALAKGGWTIAMRVHARPLDSRNQQWVEQVRADLDARMAMIPIRRDLQRGEALIDAERRALEMSAGPDRPDTGPENPEERPERPDGDTPPPGTGPMTIKDAVRTALDSGVTDPDRILAYVRTRADANAKPATVERYMRLANLAG